MSPGSWEWRQKSMWGQFNNLGYEFLLELTIHHVFMKVQVKVHT